MENLDRNKLKKEETCLIAPCGIYCGACDSFLEKSKSHAKELHRILKGFNLADVSSFTMGIEQERMIDFLNILEQMSQSNKCPGCLNGGGNPECPIKVCAKKLGYLTCAECDKMPCRISEQGSEGESMEAPFFLEMITKRYANWNIENLKRKTRFSGLTIIKPSSVPRTWSLLLLLIPYLVLAFNWKWL